MKRINVRWQLILYDSIIYLFGVALLVLLYGRQYELLVVDLLLHLFLTLGLMILGRTVGSVYRQIWRYGGIQCYLLLVAVDSVTFLVNVAINYILLGVFSLKIVPIAILFACYCINLLGGLVMRMVYRYTYKFSNNLTPLGRALALVLRIFAGIRIKEDDKVKPEKIRIAIMGAGRVGVALAEELMNNSSSQYEAGCFIDGNRSKTDRTIHGMPVFLDDDVTLVKLKELDIREVVVAIPDLAESEKMRIYDRYSHAGYKVKVYDYPLMQSAGGRRSMREFDIEELLFRKPVILKNDKTNAYYRDKVILITGGGGSIGSELCRQLAKMEPRRIVVLDIYENGAYDIQQELKIAYKGNLDVVIEIASVTNRAAMRRVFEEYRPDIVINAAAHKHVPLMEHNCIEAVENNVFGTKNLVDLCEEYGTGRFMMVSTDKAVNPTNVMGATKRMCEMIVQSASTVGNVKYSATRFGNVLGSAGSVIPLFKKQIASGGPITLTDKRIIRYFMTIPEASQLVLESGAMANNGELFVLDMGQPIKILDLAESMIRLSGVKDIEIIETGLRPGEKLYEELLVNKDELDKTENELIFIERETPPAVEEVEEMLHLLYLACRTGDNEKVRDALHLAVPTYKSMDEVNCEAEKSREMSEAR